MTSVLSLTSAAELAGPQRPSGSVPQTLVPPPDCSAGFEVEYSHHHSAGPSLVWPWACSRACVALTFVAGSVPPTHAVSPVVARTIMNAAPARLTNAMFGLRVTVSPGGERRQPTASPSASSRSACRKA